MEKQTLVRSYVHQHKLTQSHIMENRQLMIKVGNWKELVANVMH